MSRKGLVLLMGVLLVLGFTVPSFAQLKAEAGDFKFTVGGAERIRHEYWKNNFDMDNQLSGIGDLNFFRFRTQVYGQVDIGSNFDFYLRLMNEFRAYTFRGGNPGKNYHFDLNEVVFDNIYIDIKKPFDIPLSFRIGRQDLAGYGEGFVIADGTPGDGSRSAYFNAFKATWEISAEKGKESTLDFIYTINPRDDLYFPVMNEDKAPQALNTTKEEGYILYLKTKAIENLALEPYYIYKREADVGGTGLQAEKGTINTIGAYAKYTMGSLAFRAQLAEQFGKYGAYDKEATGGYLYIDKEFKEVFWKPTLTIGDMYLSGDNKGTGDSEGWNPLFSRVVGLSDLIGNNFRGESGISSYWTNLQMIRTGVLLKPTDKIKWSIFYNYLRANKLTVPNATYSLSGASKDRGHLVQSKLEYTFNKNLSTFFQAEYFMPGDFYSSTADEAVFLRTEVSVKF